MEEQVTFFLKKKLTLGKCSNFFVFKDFLIKISVQSDLLLKRTNLESIKSRRVQGEGTLPSAGWQKSPIAHDREKTIIWRCSIARWREMGTGLFIGMWLIIQNTRIKQPAATNFGHIRYYTSGLRPLTDTPFEDLGERLQSAPAQS